MPSNVEFILKRKTYNSSTDSSNGVLVFDKSTGRIYAGGVCFGSDIQDVDFDSSTGVLSILKTDGTTTTVNFSPYEKSTNKVTSLSTESTHTQYPSAKCIYGYSKEKPEVIWRAATLADGILASESDMSATPNWQITGLDMTKYQKLKLFIRSGGSGNDTTSSAIISIGLDGISKSPFGHYLGSAVVQNPNNRNRLLALSAAISEDKTSVLFNRCTSLYGTAATSANTDGRVLYKIVGYVGNVGHSYQIIGPDTFTGKNFNLVSKYDGIPVTSQWTLVTGGEYATINQWGRVDIKPDTVGEYIVVQANYTTYTEQKTIQISYDNQLIIQGPDTITGTSGSVVASYNNNGCVPVWSITSGNANATINEYGELTILQSGNITIQAVYNGYTTTKNVELIYQAGTTQETVINPDGSVTETTTTETTDPQTGVTTTETTSTTTNEDGSTSYTQEETNTNPDGSSTSSSTTTNSDGTSSESTTNTTAPDPETGSVTSNTSTTNYDDEGNTTGSSTNTTTENTDGSSTSSTTNYNASGNATNTTNENIDTSGNNSTQEIEYDEQGNGTVTEYTIDTTENPEGEKSYDGDGEDTDFIAFDGQNGFQLHIRFRGAIAEQPNPPIVPDPTDSSRLYTIVNLMEEKSPWPGIVIRFSSKSTNLVTTIVYINTSGKSTTKTQNITKTKDNVYDLTITYDPSASSNNVILYDNLTQRTIWSVTGSITSHDITTTIGYSYYPAGGYNYRYSNFDLYDFNIVKI